MTTDGFFEWVVNPVLDRAFGYGKTIDEIAMMIRRGIYGIDGVCRWIETVVRLGVAETLLEEKMEKLEFMKWCGVGC